jgi:hypothetical protein
VVQGELRQRREREPGAEPGDRHPGGDAEQPGALADAGQQQHPAGQQGDAGGRSSAPGRRSSRRPASGATSMKGRIVGR